MERLGVGEILHMVREKTGKSQGISLLLMCSNLEPLACEVLELSLMEANKGLLDIVLGLS